MPSYKLSYFDAKGRAEAIRLALHCSGISFTDERLTMEQFAEKKESFPFGQVPVLTIDDKKMIPQQVAILQHIGRLSGLYPSDAEEALQVDVVINCINDIYSALSVFYMPDNPGKEALKKMVVEDRIPKLFGYLERYLAKDGTPFSAGNKLTIADLQLYSVISGMKSGALNGCPTDLVDKYSYIMKLHQAIDGHEKVASWNKSQAK